jgi:hypothetical protein
LIIIVLYYDLHIFHVSLMNVIAKTDV